MHGLCTFFSTCAIVAAQTVTATATAGTSMRVSCTFGPTNWITPGTNLTAGGVVTTQGSGATGSAHATTTFQPLYLAPYEVRATLVTDIGATRQPSGQVQAQCGTPGDPIYFLRHDVLLTLQAAVPVRGRFAITYSAPPPVWPGPIDYFAVDIGDDHTIEATNIFFSPLPPLVPVSFGPGTFRVRMNNAPSGAMGGFGSYEYIYSFALNADLTVRFVPDSGCTAVQVAPACGGLSLVPQQNFTLGSDQLVQGLLPPGNGLAALVYGFQPANTTLPLPPGCVLAATADAVRLLFADAAGRATHSIATVPLSLRPCSLFAQAVELDAAQGTLATSESFRIDCR